MQKAADCAGLHTWISIRAHALPFTRCSHRKNRIARVERLLHGPLLYFIGYTLICRRLTLHFGSSIEVSQHQTSRAFRHPLRTARELRLVSNDETGDTGTGQCREDTRHKSRHSETRNITATTRADLAEHTDLGTERTDVTETAKCVSGDKTGSGGKGVVVRVGVVARLEHGEGNELVGDDLDTNETTDEEQVLALARYTEQESNGVEDVSEDELKGEVVLAVEVDVAAPPGEETVNQTQESNNTQECANDHTGDLKTKPSAVGEGVKSVGSLVLIVIGNDDASSGEGLLRFGVAEFGQSKRSWDTHDTGGDESLGVQSHSDVGNEDRTSNGSETRAHDLVELGHGQVGNERLDQHGRFTLTDKRRSGSDNSLGTGDLHRPEEEDSELADEPLDKSPVVHELDDRHEEDNRRDNAEEEEGVLGDIRGGKEGDTLFGKSKELTSKLRDEAEDVVTNASSQNKEGDDELNQHTDDDGVPVDRLSVARSGPEGEDEHGQTKERNSTVGAGVVLALLTGHGTNDDDGNGKRGASRSAQLRRNHLSDPDSGVVPDPVHGLCDDGDGDVARDDADHDGQPEQERNDPVLVVAVQDDRRDPPSNTVSSRYLYNGLTRCGSPGEQSREEGVHGPSIIPVDGRWREFALLLLLFVLRVCGTTAGALLFIINVGVLLIRARLVKAMLLRQAVVQAMVLGTGVRDGALLVSGSDRVRDVVVVHGARAVVHVLMRVFLGGVKGQVVAGQHALLGRRVMLVHVGHVESGHKSNSCQRR